MALIILGVLYLKLVLYILVKEVYQKAELAVSDCKFKKIILSLLVVFVLSGCSGLFEKGGLLSHERWGNENLYADKAILSLIKGNIEDAEENVKKTLRINPKNPYALLVGAIIYENIGHPNRARQYYEDILTYKPSVFSLLSNINQLTPVSIRDTAQERIQIVNIRENRPVWSVSDETSSSDIAPYRQPAPRRYESFENDTFAPVLSSEVIEKPCNVSRIPSFAEKTDEGSRQLFDEDDVNSIARFVTFKKLAEEGLITRDEFLLRRKENLGALLPFTRRPPAIGLGRAVPSNDMIVSRLQALRSAFEMRSITAREYAAERSVILDALLPAVISKRARHRTAPKDLLLAATAVRRLETLKKMGLITAEEKKEERWVIEHMLRMGSGMGDTSPANQAKINSSLLVTSLSKPRTLVPTMGKNEVPLGGMGIHIASFKSKHNAMKGVREFQNKFSRLLGDYESHIIKTDLGAGKGTYYRVVFGPVGDDKAAKKLCSKLKRRNQYCLPTFISK